VRALQMKLIKSGSGKTVDVDPSRVGLDNSPMILDCAGFFKRPVPGKRHPAESLPPFGKLARVCANTQDAI